MARQAGIVGVLLTLLVVSAAPALSRQSSNAGGTQMLNATFNAEGGMRLSLADGTSAGSPSPPGPAISPGPYLVVVNNNDSADNFGDTHRFHLTGPGVDVEAVLTQDEEAQATWTVTFQTNSTYTFQDDYRPGLIHLVFHTSSSAPSVAATSSASGGTSAGGASSSGSAVKNPDVVGSAIKPVPFRGTLTGAVGASGALTLKFKGKAVETLKAGRYKIVVTDKSLKSGFTIQEIRKAATTVSGVAFRGTRSVTLHLITGQWFAYPTLVGKKIYFIVHA